MLSTYQAILRDGVLEWLVDKPKNLASKHALPVYVTVLEENGFSTETDQGLKMAAALTQLAETQTTFTAVDPLQWEREVRQERELPGRNDNAN